MSATNSTINLGLPQFADNDRPTWRGDVNGAFGDIDSRFGNVAIDQASNEAELADRYTKADADALLAEKANETAAVVSAVKNGVSVAGTAADNTAALNTLHTSALAAGTVIELPAGIINLDTLLVRQTMRGAGKGKTILNVSGLVTVAQSNLRLSDFTVLSANSTAVSIANVNDVTIDSVFVDFTAAVVTNWLAFDLYQISRLRVMRSNFRIGGLQLSKCEDFLIDGNYWDCEYVNINEPCHISGQSYGQFVNNTVYRTLTDAVDLYSSGKHCVIANNRFHGLRGAAGIECKVTMSDDPNNTSSPDNKFEATLIVNNQLFDFNTTVTSTRQGIFAEYIDNRAIPAFAVAESNRAIVISGNIIDGMNLLNPGAGIIASYWAISYVGHNGLITNNVISNLRTWNGSSPIGVKLTSTLAAKCVGTRISGNSITGIENGAGIEVGNLDRCQIDNNIIRGTEELATQTRLGVSIVAGASLVGCSISNNIFECNYATGFGVRTGSTACTISKTKIDGNIFKDCGAQITCPTTYSSFSGNTMDNALNSQGVIIGSGGFASKLLRIHNNHVTMSSDYGISVNDCDGFTITGNTFQDTARGIILIGVTKDGVVANNVSFAQANGAEMPYYSGVSAGDQATIAVANNKVV